ncbi:hypothetical protein F5Y14DRAFT_452102 [Nemania sp. NC0429]|nr:hypothetical protein F5Y14DRAFT_452102 [Nemania sp. NC0429]
MEGEVYHDNAEQASTAVDLPTEIHQPPPPPPPPPPRALSDGVLQQGQSRSPPSSPVSSSRATMKREFESAFPGEPPEQETKRFRSQSALSSYPDTNGTTIGDSGPAVEGAVKHDDAGADADADANADSNATGAHPDATDTHAAATDAHAHTTDADAIEADVIEAGAMDADATDAPAPAHAHAADAADADVADTDAHTVDADAHADATDLHPIEADVIEADVFDSDAHTADADAHDAHNAHDAYNALDPDAHAHAAATTATSTIDTTVTHTTIAPSIEESEEIVQPSSQSPHRLEALVDFIRSVEETLVNETNAVAGNETLAHAQAENIRESSREEIRRHIMIIKQSSTDGQIDPQTTEMLRNEVLSLAAGDNVAAEIPAAINPWSADGPVSQTCPSLSRPFSPPYGPTPSPLTPYHSSPPHPSVSAAPPSSVNNAKFEEAATQTDAAVAHRDSDVSDTRRHEVSDNELWERELEHIRRPQPLFEGQCTVVRVPLRTPATQQQVSKPASAGNYKSVIKLRLNPEPSLHYGTASGNENRKVIDLLDSSEDDDVYVRTSRRAGGCGDFSYGSNEAQYAYSEEGDESMGINEPDPFFFGPQSSSYLSAAADDFLDYEYGEDYDRYEDFANDESPEEEELTGHNEYAGRPAESLGRYTHDGAADDNTDNTLSPAMASQGGVGHDNLHDARIAASETHGRDDPAWPRRINPNPYTRQRQRYMKEEPEAASFYGYSATTTSAFRADQILRYQDRFADAGEIPGPRSGLRLKLDEYVRDTGINKEAKGLERGILSVLGDTFYSGETFDEEQAWHHSWANDSIQLFKGFPLVENIEFVAAGNNDEPSGDCYWRALAFSLHGTPVRWDIVKADHLAYLKHVLGDKTHPRHELYTKLNERFFESHGPIVENGGVFSANLWQLLHMPHVWTPGAMQQISADLYNLHLVTFTYDGCSNLCSEVSVRGAYNGRHEFRYPRVTVAATARFTNAPKAGSRKVGHPIQHPWRNDWTKEVPPPVATTHGCDLFRLRKFMSVPQAVGVSDKARR